jgi:hypothetical protein
MAAITPTASQVVPADNAVIDASRVAGATITAGQLVYLDANDSYKAKLFDSDGVGTTTLYGIAVGGASAGQTVPIQVGGDLDLGADAAAATAGYVVHGMATAGAITITTADVAVGAFMGVIGVGYAAGKIRVSVINAGAAKL